jgi:hypothetical protein
LSELGPGVDGAPVGVDLRFSRHEHHTPRRVDKYTDGVSVGRLRCSITPDFLAVVVGEDPVASIDAYVLNFVWHPAELDRLLVRGVAETVSIKPKVCTGAPTVPCAGPAEVHHSDDDDDDVDWGAALRPKQKRRRTAVVGAAAAAEADAEAEIANGDVEGDEFEFVEFEPPSEVSK